MTTIEEKRLIKKCIQNDRMGQRVLYEQYKVAMFSTAYRITNDIDVAHDVLQEAFMKVFVNLSKYKGSGSLAGWIKTIVIRTALKELKGLHLHLEVDEKIEDPVHFDDSLTGEMLAKLMASLPDKCRAVFCLIEVEGYSQKEVSEMVNVQIGTVKSQLHYAKKLLKRGLYNSGYGLQNKG